VLLSTFFSGWNEMPFGVQTHLLLLDFHSNPVVSSAFKIQKSYLYDQSAHISTVWFSCTTCFHGFFPLIPDFLFMPDFYVRKKGIMEGRVVCEESEGEHCLHEFGS